VKTRNMLRDSLSAARRPAAVGPLILVVVSAVLITFAGCAGEIISESFAFPQSSSDGSTTPAGRSDVTRDQGPVSESDAAGLKDNQLSENISSNPNREKKETRTMWFASGNKSIEHVNAATFRTAVLESDVPVLVDFYADWCGPCRALAPVLEQLAQEIDGVRIVKVNVDQAPTLAAQYRVSAIPTMILFDRGKPVQRVTGLASKDELKRLLAVD